MRWGLCVLLFLVIGHEPLQADEKSDLAERCEAIDWDGAAGAVPAPLRAIAKELRGLGPKALEQIEPAMERSVNLRRITPAIIEVWPSDRTRRLLLDLARDVDRYTARRAVDSLGVVGGAEVVTGLLAATKHADGNVRHNAINALGRIGAHRHGLDAALSAVAERASWIRWSAYQFLEHVGWKKGVLKTMPVLEAALARETDGGAKRALERAIRVLRARGYQAR